MKLTKKSSLSLIAVFSLFFAHASHAEWVSRTALPAVEIRYITYDAANMTYYAAATGASDPRVFSKTEAATSWTVVGPEMGTGAYYGSIRCLLRTSTPSNTVYVGDTNAVYKKSDTDSGWTQVGNNITGANALVRYNDTLIVSAASLSTSGVYTLNLNSSSATWTRLGPAMGAGSLTSTSGLFLDSDKLYATREGNVYAFDFTAMTPSWVLQGPASGTAGGTPMSIIQREFTVKNNVILVATSQGIYSYKVGGGGVWQRIGAASGAGSLVGDTNSVAVSPDSKKIFAAADDGTVQSVTFASAISTTTDFTAAIWSAVNATKVYPRQLLAVGANLYAASYFGVYKTIIAMPSWADISVGLPQKTPVNLLHFNSTLLAGTEIGVYQTDDSFNPWHLVGPEEGVGNARDYATALLHANSKIYTGTDGGVFSRADTDPIGGNWTRENPPTPAPQFFDSTACLANSSTSIFAGTFDGVFSRTGNGEWTDVSAAGTSSNLFRRNNKLLYANARLYAATQNGVWSKTDAETTLSFVGPATGPGSLTIPVNDLALSGNKIFACTEGGVFSKEESAADWTTITPVLPNCFAIVRRDDSLYAGTSDAGVYSKKDTETAWTRLGPDAGAGSYTSSVYSLIADGNTLYLGSTNKGVFTFTLPPVSSTGGSGGSGTGGTGGDIGDPAGDPDALSGSSGCSLIVE